MHLDIAEIHRIAERLGVLDVRGKMLVSFITVRAEDRKICSEMGFMPHQLQPAILALCTELHMTHLEKCNWRDYVRAATILLVESEKPAPPSPKERKYRIKKKTLREVEPFIARFVKEGEKTHDPILSAMYLHVPQLARFALSLCGNAEQAEELVQEGLTHAYANLATFHPGENVKGSVNAWLSTIVRNFFLSERRKQRRTVEDPEGIYADTLRCQPDQFDSLELKEVQKALLQLPSEQREAVMLVGLGYSYDEVACTAACAEGTVKSRVNRGRSRLAELTDREIAHAIE